MNALDQCSQRVFKPDIVLGVALRRAFDVGLAAGPAGFFGQVALHQEGVDIVIGIPPAALVDPVGALAEGHGCEAVILGDDDIPGTEQVEKREIDRVRAGADGTDFAVVRGKDMIRVAEQDHRDAVFLGDPLRDPDNRAGIGVNKDMHVIILYKFVFLCFLQS